MNLNDSQKQAVTGWMADGLKLADIQKRLSSEFGLSLTYMEVRMLVDDLKLIPKDPEPVKPPEPPVTPAPAPVAGPADLPKLAPEPLPAGAFGEVTLTVDQVTRPGTLTSGKVTFSDGVKAEWYLDQMGRLGLSAQNKGYKPVPADIETFQTKLELELRKLGY